MKIHSIGAFDAKTHFSELLEKVGKGQTFIITKHGRAVAELRPLPKQDATAEKNSTKGKGAQAPTLRSNLNLRDGEDNIENTFGSLKKFSKPHEVDSKGAWAAGAAERDKQSRKD